MRVRKLLPLLGCLLTAAPVFAAKGKAARTSAPRPKVNLDAFKQALESGDETRVLAALAEIKALREPTTAPLVDALLGRGATTKILIQAIEASAGLGQESSSNALAPYVAHRSSDVRRAAVRALANTRGQVAVQALRAALRGSDNSLRGDAAQGLGMLGAKEAVPDLVAVLPHDVPEAALAIGMLCSEDECSKFIALLGKLPFDVMQRGFEPILLRPPAELPDRLKFKLIERLRRLATKPATDVLATALARYPEGGSPKVKAALDAALHGRSVAEGEP